jgi:hypothetical protein
MNSWSGASWMALASDARAGYLPCMIVSRAYG